MRESRIRRYVDFVYFNQESEGYPMTSQAEAFVRKVLAEDLSGDEAVSEIIDLHGLSSESDSNASIGGCYSGSDVYRNFFGIRDQNLLDEVELLIVSVRMAGILASEREWTFNFEHLKTIHAMLFSDLYPYAGTTRYIPITRRTVFCLPQYIDRMADEIFSKLREDHYLRDQSHEEFIDNLAYFMAEIHALHPFLDGNTRTMRLFFLQLCHAAGWEMNASSLSDSRLLEADIAALEGDYQPLISLLHEVIEPL